MLHTKTLKTQQENEKSGVTNTPFEERERERGSWGGDREASMKRKVLVSIEYFFLPIFRGKVRFECMSMEDYYQTLYGLCSMEVA